MWHLLHSGFRSFCFAFLLIKQMAVFLPLLVVGGAPVCYATYKVFLIVDKETTRLIAPNEQQPGKTSLAMVTLYAKSEPERNK